jgi:hypothetical protein
MLSRTFALALFLSLVGVCVARADVETALSKLENFKVGDGTAALNASIAELRAKTSAGDFAIWKRLRVVIEDAAIPLRVRTEVLQLGLEKADDIIAKDALALFSAWSDQLPASDKYIPNTEADARITLLTSFVRVLRNGPWDVWLGSEARSYEFLEQIVLRTTLGMHINHDAVRSLIALSGKPGLQRATAERIVASRRGFTEHEPILLGLLDPSSYDKLRALVRESSDPERFHFGAAAALAHLGDTGIRADLEALLTTFQKKDRNLGGMLAYYLWQIDAQHPLSGLLKYIASDEDIGVEKRLWAIKRAAQAGLPMEEIRSAILGHAERVPLDQHGNRPGLSSIKSLGLRLGLLKDADLPDVRTVSIAP